VLGHRQECLCYWNARIQKGRTREHHRDADGAQDDGATREKATANQRRHGFLLVVTAEILATWGTDVIFTGACWRGLCYWKARGSVGGRGGVFFALVVYFAKEGFEFYFLLGGH
jgi:hypothetical protein